MKKGERREIFFFHLCFDRLGDIVNVVMLESESDVEVLRFSADGREEL